MNIHYNAILIAMSSRASTSGLGKNTHNAGSIMYGWCTALKILTSWAFDRQPLIQTNSRAEGATPHPEYKTIFQYKFGEKRLEYIEIEKEI